MKEMKFAFNGEKNEKLKTERGIGFEEIVTLIETDHLVVTSDHPNQERYPGQRIYEIEVNDYMYFVPFIEKGGEVFLKTIYANRKVTKKRLRGKYGKKTFP